MLRITAKAFHEKLSTPDKEEIVLNGAPGALRGSMRISNRGEDILRVHSLPLRSPLKKGGGGEGELRMFERLGPGEDRVVSLTHNIAADTPPGTYEHELMIGGEIRKVRMIVQEDMSIDLHPTRFTFTGTEPGRTHLMVLTLTNTGNVPFIIPEIKHVAALDMDMLCTVFGMAVRNPKAEGYEGVLNEIVRNIRNTLPDWAIADVKESGASLAPGATRIINISLTIPKDSKPQKDYEGNMRFWNKEITYAIRSDGKGGNNPKQDPVRPVPDNPKAPPEPGKGTPDIKPDPGKPQQEPGKGTPEPAKPDSLKPGNIKPQDIKPGNDKIK